MPALPRRLSITTGVISSETSAVPVHDRPDGRTENTPEGTADGTPEGWLEGSPVGWRGCDDVPELGTGAGRDGAGLLLEAGLGL